MDNNMIRPEWIPSAYRDRNNSDKTETVKKDGIQVVRTRNAVQVNRHLNEKYSNKKRRLHYINTSGEIC